MHLPVVSPNFEENQMGESLTHSALLSVFGVNYFKKYSGIPAAKPT
jgi:hypothetical protein